jgi:hypothetical protein
MFDADASRVVRFYFRVPVEQIAYVRFVVESYEGLAQVTSLPGRTDMQWLVPIEHRSTAEALARALASEVQLVPIPCPPDWPDTPGPRSR